MEQVIARLEPLLTERRKRRMRDVLATRSDHVALVFERMVDPHNLSAVLRTMEAMSFQDAWLIAPTEGIVLPRGIALGTQRWVSVHEAPDAAACFAALRARGYRIVASHVRAGRGVPLAELDAGRRLALVFGNEHDGVTSEVLAQADELFHIPMLGFVESLNLSVAAAICVHHLRREIERLRRDDAQPQRFSLCPERQRELYATWLRLSVRRADRILAEAGIEVPPLAGIPRHGREPD